MDVLECVTKQLIAQDEAGREFSRTIYLVYAAALVFFMQAGFAMLCAGSVRLKNVQNTMLKNLLDACGASIAFYSVGYAFAFGDGKDPNGFIGTTNFFLVDVDDLAFWLFQYAFSAASATIVAGTLAERCQMAAYLCYSIILTGMVYPVIAHSIWSDFGFLSAENTKPLFGIGVVDFAGGGVVHLTGGLTALFATMILGPRRGRFHDEEGRKLAIPKEFPGHSVALRMLGTFTLWFGWYVFGFQTQTSSLCRGF
jgi:Amt family ammonium transporter